MTWGGNHEPWVNLLRGRPGKKERSSEEHIEHGEGIKNQGPLGAKREQTNNPDTETNQGEDRDAKHAKNGVQP